MKGAVRALLGGVLCGLMTAGAQADDLEFQTELSAEMILFGREATEGQLVQPSLTVTPEFKYSGDLGSEVISAKLFARLSRADTGRSHVDIRDLSWTRAVGDWEWKIGISRENWGVMESIQLVDVINQLDDKEALDNKARLGQPMARLSYLVGDGTISAWVLPFFRARNFARPAGRIFSGGIDVASERAEFHSPWQELHPDIALRYAHVVGDADVAVSLFRGTARSPDLRFDPAAGHFVPFYDRQTQASLDAQWTGDALLLKAEGLWRRKSRQGNSAALVGGFEYTFFDLGGTGHDLGLIAEYMHDGAGRDRTSFDNDLFAGLRYTLNDVGGTELLAGGFVDLSDGTTILRAKYQQRIGDSWKVELIAQGFANVAPDDLFFTLLKDDSFFRINLRTYF